MDLNAGAPIPMEADLLIWVDPVTFTPSRLRELNLYLESGRSAVIAAGEQTIEYVTGAAGTPRSRSNPRATTPPLCSPSSASSRCAASSSTGTAPIF